MEEFKTMDGSFKRLASTSGHVVVVGPDWTPVPEVLVEEALRARCVPKSLLESKPAEEDLLKDQPPGGGNPPPAGPSKEAILAALAKVDAAVEEGKDTTPGGVKLQTDRGQPAVDAVSEYVGAKVTRAEIEAALQ